jgi:hypothetical protein
MRWELRVHSFGSDWPVYWSYLVNLGPVALMRGYAGNVVQASTADAPAGVFDAVYNNGPQIIGCCSAWTDALVRVQRDVANSRYTMEACNVSTGSCMSGTAAITSYGQPSWAGQSLDLASGGDIAFVRWFSGVVPLGTPIPVAGVTGDLGDWEFEGNLLDSSGHSNAFSGGPASYAVTPNYLPVCSAGAQQTFRVGYAGGLDGSGSYPLDGGTSLSYAWRVASGPSTPVLPSATAVGPAISGLVFGTYVFQLTVTDSSGQSSVCTVKDGAVATDGNNIVVTNNAAVDTLLGPMVRYGANPWPWFDNRHKQAADNQRSVMDAYFPAWWDTPAPGTVTVTAGGAAVAGVGTAFTTTFCQGPANPTAPKAGYSMIAVWHPLGAGTGREMDQVASCTDDTHLTLVYPYANSGNSPLSLAGSGLSYAADNQYAAMWGWGLGSASPANYYDNVAAYYALYYRSGIDDYLTAARTLADRFWASPMIDQGLLPGQFVYGAARQTSALGLMLRALDGRPDMWTGLHLIWNTYMWYLNTYDPQYSLWDTREEAYHLATVSYCALFDADAAYRSNCQASIATSFDPRPAVGVWPSRMFPDGSWPQMYSVSTSWGTGSGAALTKGSATVTAVGNTGWTAAYFPTRIWFTNSPAAGPANNAAGDPVSYRVTFVDATHLTLGSPYQGTTGAHGWELANASDAPVTGWATEPFMEGILGAAFDLAAKAVTNSNPTVAALAHGYNVTAANWIKNYAYWPAAKGLYYYAGGVECQLPIADTNTVCTVGNSPGQARTLSAEAVRGLSAAYSYSQDQTLKTFIDTLYNAMWAAPGSCPSGSTLCVPDGSYIDPLNDGQYMIAAPAVSSLGNATPWKWFGDFFGFNAESSWPGNRIGGLQPGAGEQLYIGANLPGVPGAAAIQVVTTDPGGVTYTTNCNASPCAVTVDRRQGDHLLSVRYLSASGAVLASSSAPLIGGQ